MFVCYPRDAFNIDPPGRSVLMIERLLHFDETADLFGNDPRIGVIGLMRVKCFRPASFEYFFNLRGLSRYTTVHLTSLPCRVHRRQKSKLNGLPRLAGLPIHFERAVNSCGKSRR